MGAVTTTFIAGVAAIRKGLGNPIGSLTQMGTIRLGKRTDNRSPKIKEFVPLAGLDDLVFGGWDIFPDNMYEASVKADVLTPQTLAPIKDELAAIQPMSAVFDKNYVKLIDGPNVKQGATLMDKAEMLMEDIRQFKERNNCSRLVMIWCGSTEVFHSKIHVHETMEAFEAGLRNNDPAIAPSQVYAYAALKLGVPFINGAPNLTTDVPALSGFARESGIPIAGKDFKTGQTFMKTLLAPGLKSRMLGVSGWFSTNILGNRDGEVLHDPGSFKTKEETKLSVLDTIFQPHLPGLHRISTMPCGSIYLSWRREGWDNIDIFGWLNCDADQGELPLPRFDSRTLRWCSIWCCSPILRSVQNGSGMALVLFKGPMTAPGLYPEHDIFIQLMKLKNTLRWMMGENLITHLGLEYYD